MKKLTPSTDDFQEWDEWGRFFRGIEELAMPKLRKWFKNEKIWHWAIDPIESYSKEAKDIIELIKTNKIKLMVGHIERFNPAIIELKKRLDKNDLGEIYKIDVQRIGPFPTRIADVGVIIDLSVHDIDIIYYLTGSKPKRIYL